MKFIRLFLSTGCFTGYVPRAPGTLGSLVGVALFLLVPFNQALHLALIWLLLLAAFPLGDWAETFFKSKDPQKFVLDEIVGYLITVLLLPASIPTAIVGFITFRFFDILKPFQVRQVQELPGGAGIVLDDVLAGIYSNLLLHAVAFFLPGLL